MDISIREATERDFEALCLIIEEVDRMHREVLPRRFKPPAGPVREPSYILQAIRAPEVGLFVAQNAGQLVGFVHVIVRETPDVAILVPRRYAVVDSLAVKEGMRRKGVGHALMRKAEAWAAGKGASSVELTVYAFNQAAEQFYEQLGYQVLTHRMTKRLGGAAGLPAEGSQ